MAGLIAPILGALAPTLLSKIFKFKEGGMVKGKKGKAVLAMVHGGERVLTPAQNKVYEKVMKEKGKPVSKKSSKKMK
jgi:hypothetical protein